MMELDWNAARFLWQVFQTLFIAAVAVYSWWQGRERATRQELEELRNRLHQLDRRIDGRPEFSHFDELKQQLATTNSELREVSARLDATTSLLNRLHEYLLTHPGGQRQ